MSARSMPTRTLLPSLERARGRRWRLTRARAASGEMPSRSAISTYVSRSIMGDVRLVTVRTRLPADGCRSVNDRLVTTRAKLLRSDIGDVSDNLMLTNLTHWTGTVTAVSMRFSNGEGGLEAVHGFY